MCSTTLRGASDGPASAEVYFGGPDKPPRLLRDLLRERIDAVPAGGEIVWATYYFRDRDLASALIVAAQRGVRVVLRIEGAPRRAGANDAVLEMLRKAGARGGVQIELAVIEDRHSHLHSKIYYFSHPAPAVLVGSFNPSGDEPEDRDVIAEIGDQDRGHNVLIELSNPMLATALRHYVVRLPWACPRLRNNRTIEAGNIQAWFFPRFRTAIAERTVIGAQRICGCISHLKPGLLVDRLSAAARQGTEIRLLVHDTSRRVPEESVSALRNAGVEVRRFIDREGLPLHAKFLVIDDVAWFGSYNFNPRSRWLNREVLLASKDLQVNQAFALRFEEIWSSVGAQREA